mmetsp:Transcript_65100/g.183243  ORF Transcript_65100/g.183243 Transcript_65100/m.183243 type:complete len:394 (-) Transcript_65100:87-1268(-)|eukprot:CAMPEP_0179244400 /NCGR_PEP_ID=MMETSP0797-20121207/18038_1 /TAXON_ID=47934 /ORGANISM="Dinophysis acuminata, Strain DAEP01" /LENGTH=393 /DNA_ID=CAMNT_0020951915 /DNA_START=90 /DNA_END=1271 /DNA_ORIENTATION=-
MTNYNAWDAKASRLAKEAEEEDARQKAENDKALGLEGGPKGPPTANAEKQLDELNEHSGERKDFIDWHKRTLNEVTFTHTPPQEQDVEIDASEVERRSVRFVGSEGVRYVVPHTASVMRVTVDTCRHVTIHVDCPLLTTSIELIRCDAVTVVLREPLGTVQADECTGDVRLQYAEYDHIGGIYHQNCPGLAIGWGGGDVEFFTVGVLGDFQLSTRRLAGSTSELATLPVQRGEGDFPVDLRGQASAGAQQPEPEEAPAAEELKRQAQAKAQENREKGNDMFRANDFMQATSQYTVALELDPTLDAVWANRSQCWLKVGNPEKALEDAVRCTEVNPLNPKGWFRKGMSLHAMERYQEAIPALLEAEKLEPNNRQVSDAIKMAQLKARSQAAAAS